MQADDALTCSSAIDESGCPSTEEALARAEEKVRKAFEKLDATQSVSAKVGPLRVKSQLIRCSGVCFLHGGESPRHRFEERICCSVGCHQNRSLREASDAACMGWPEF